jgi:predicted O-methyltransferase YrrM
MSNHTIYLNDAIYQYLLTHSLRESPVLEALRTETTQHSMVRMQISPEQGQFMTLLLRLINAKRAIEVGVYTGYSSICIAEALGQDGQLIACDVNEEWTTMASQYWQRAGLSERIDLRLAPARETLQGLIDDGQQGAFDFVFIDADKTHYETYYEQALVLLKSGGLVAVDNTLWSGSVVDDTKDDEDTIAIRRFNDKVAADERVDLSLLPLGDGLTLLRKRAQ